MLILIFDSIAFYVDKGKNIKTNSCALWHKRLGYISQRRMDELEIDGILPPLTNDLNNCLECAKEKWLKLKEQV